MLREYIGRLDAVLFTHAHRDHTAGLDDVRAYNFLQDMDMPIYGTQATLDQLAVNMRMHYLARPIQAYHASSCCPSTKMPLP